MKKVMSIVYHKKQKVGEVEIPVYDTLEELLQSEKPEVIVARFNKGNKITLQGNVRSKGHSTKGKKEQLKQLAFKLLTSDEIVSFAGRYNELEAYLVSDEMQARVQDYLASANDASAD